MALTDTGIRKASKKPKPYKLTDGKGLFIEVRPSGSKLWRYRYRINDKENVFAMGEYYNDPKTPGHLSLEDARAERARCRHLVKQGIHPAQDKKTAKAQRQADSANTFEAIAREWLEKNRPHWAVRHHGDVERALEKDVFPDVGALPIRQVTAAHVLKILDKVNTRGAPVMAINMRQWCSGVFVHAVRTLRADGDPTGVLKGHIKRPATRHKTPLTKDGIKDLVEKIDTSAYITTRFALKLLLYMFVRPGELRAAEWTEFDLDRGVWTIPGEKMKKGERHLVPLSTQVLQLLRSLKDVSGGRPYLFPNHRRPKDHLSGNALNAALARLGYKGQFTAHGFRATASTELHELGFPSDLIEFQLAHAERNQTKASYNHAQFWDSRKAMMQQWADLVDAWSRGDKDRVVSLGAKRAG